MASRCLLLAPSLAVATACTEESESTMPVVTGDGKADDASVLGYDTYRTYNLGPIACSAAAVEQRLATFVENNGAPFLAYELRSGEMQGRGECADPSHSVTYNTDYVRCNYRGSRPYAGGIDNAAEQVFYYCGSNMATLVRAEYTGEIGTASVPADETILVNTTHGRWYLRSGVNYYYNHPLCYATLRGDGRVVGLACFNDPERTKLFKLDSRVVVVSDIPNYTGFRFAIFEKDRIVRIDQGYSGHDTPIPPDLLFP